MYPDVGVLQTVEEQHPADDESIEGAIVTEREDPGRRNGHGAVLGAGDAGDVHEGLARVQEPDLHKAQAQEAVVGDRGEEAARASQERGGAPQRRRQRGHHPGGGGGHGSRGIP